MPAPAVVSNPHGFSTPELAVQAYLEARDQCDPRGLRAAFHPVARLHSVDEAGVPRGLTQLSWWQRIRTSSPCRAAVSNEVRLLDREGALALIQVVSRFIDFGFHDYLLVVDTGDGWRIVDKTFARLAPGEALAPLASEDAAAVRAVMATKIAASDAHDPALLDASHLPDCRYHEVRLDGIRYGSASLSEWAAVYAERQDRGETGLDSRWRILSLVGHGSTAAMKTELVVGNGTRYLDHLLFLRVADGWRIAAVSWGPALP